MKKYNLFHYSEIYSSWERWVQSEDLNGLYLELSRCQQSNPNEFFLVRENDDTSFFPPSIQC